MNMRQFKLLGEFQCSGVEGRDIEIPLAKNIGVIAILALSKDFSCRRNRLMDLLWSDRCEQQGRASLRHALWSLKTALNDKGGELLLADRKRVALNPDYCRIDTADFLAASRSTARQNQEHAVALYRGELLEGLQIRDREWLGWLNLERERLHAGFTQILCALLDRYQADGEAGQLIDTARRLVEHDPLCEQGHRALMQGYALSNQNSLALKQYHRYQLMLRSELDARPGQAIQDLYGVVKNGLSASERDCGYTIRAIDCAVA